MALEKIIYIDPSFYTGEQILLPSTDKSTAGEMTGPAVGL